MWQVILTHVSVKGGIVNPDIYGLLDFSGEVSPFLPTMVKFTNVVGWPVVDW